MTVMRAAGGTPHGWHTWDGTDGFLHARRPMTSPPIGVRAGTAGELAELVEQAERDLADKTFWPKVLAAREQAVDEMDLRTWQQKRWDRLRPLLQT